MTKQDVMIQLEQPGTNAVRVLWVEDALAFELRFEVGEPVHVKSLVLHSLPGFPRGENAIWFIHYFVKTDNEIQAGVGGRRCGGPTALVYVMDLAKLDGMLRIAAESAG